MLALFLTQQQLLVDARELVQHRTHALHLSLLSLEVLKLPVGGVRGARLERAAKVDVHAAVLIHIKLRLLQEHVSAGRRVALLALLDGHLGSHRDVLVNRRLQVFEVRKVQGVQDAPSELLVHIRVHPVLWEEGQLGHVELVAGVLLAGVREIDGEVVRCARVAVLRGERRVAPVHLRRQVVQLHRDFQLVVTQPAGVQELVDAIHVVLNNRLEEAAERVCKQVAAHAQQLRESVNALRVAP
mmetsp:Transcript_13702/g.26264  ORF Transcript_13702/g.26264 Transcript_13702/m.26264 type:complete len:242 (-) Transcript_13702:320-1045(-)